MKVSVGGQLPLGVGLPTSVTSKHIHYLVLLLTTCRLKNIHLMKGNVREGMPLIAEALKQNASLECVAMLYCTIGDRGLIDLGQHTHTSATRLLVPGNPFSSSAFSDTSFSQDCRAWTLVDR